MILRKQKNFYKKKIIFVTDNIFNHRDYERYGISFLSKKLDVKIFTFNSNHLKKKNVYFFKNYSSLKDHLKKEKPDFCIDLLFPSLTSFLVKKVLKSLNVKLIKLNLSTYPIERQNFLTKITNFLNKKKNFGGNIFIKMKNHFMIKLNSLVCYDYYFVDSKKSYPQNKNCEIIKNHSLDYDIYLLNKKKITKKKIIFLDSNVISHSDYSIHSTTSPVNKNKYLQDMNNFFIKIERKYNQKIIIAANPKSKLSEIKKNFKNREVYTNKTFNLIKDAKFVMTHKSTAVSFVLTLKKPIIFLTSNDLEKTWYGDQISYQSKLIGSSLLNINSCKSNILKKHIKINKKKYKNYFYNFIKYPRTKDEYNWEIFVKKIVKV